MTMTQDPRLARAQYNQDAILSASPGRLLTMLFDRLMLDLQRAEAAQSEQDWNRASGYLIHAQDIVAELAGTLDVERWDGGQNLLAIYLFSSTKLVSANVEHSIERTREVIAIMEPLRQTWHEAAAIVAQQSIAQHVGTGTGDLGFA
ncbi:MAG: flagellar export chaperone FliS [Actinobacteria bacterium]|nr:flagellar export chaperone FliS [Actinomycetota bacterium]